MNKLEHRPAHFSLERSSLSENNFVFWALAALTVGLISFAIGAAVMWSNIYGQSLSLSPIPPLVQSSAAPTDVVVTDGINGGAGPGSSPARENH